MQTIFYTRVSTTDQTAAHQQTQAEAAGFRIDHVVADEGVPGVSTTPAARPQGRRLFDMLRAGGALVVPRSDANHIKVTPEDHQALQLKKIYAWKVNRILIVSLISIPTVMLVLSAINIGTKLQVQPIYSLLNNISTSLSIRHLSNADSWKPMIEARQWLMLHPHGDVYQDLFFNSGVKFQYPLTSLFYVSWVDCFPVNAIKLLNISNLAIFAAIIAGVPLLASALNTQLKSSSSPLDQRNRGLLTVVALLAALCFFPLLRAVALGQIQVLLTALFVYACYAMLKGWPGASGFLIGLSTLVKPQMALFLVWGVLRRDWCFVRGWMMPVTGGALASIALYGVNWPLNYLHVLSFISQHGESFFANQSVNGLLHRFLGNGTNLEWQGDQFAPYNPLVHGLTLITSVLFVWTGLNFGRTFKAPELRTASQMFAGVCFSMSSPVAWEHHYGVLLPSYVFCFVALLVCHEGFWPARRRYWVVLVATFLLAANSLSFFNLLASTVFNPLQSYLFFAAVGLLWLLATLVQRQQSWVERAGGSRGLTLALELSSRNAIHSRG